MSSAKIPERYFGFHYKALEFLGIGKFHHPDEENFNNYPTKKYLLYGILCTCINIIGYTTSETLFAIKVWKDGRESSLLFLASTLVGVHIFATIKILILIRNNKKIQKIVRVLEIDSKRFDRDPKILNDSIFLTRIVTRGFFYMGEVTITFMSIYSITEDFNRKTKPKESNYTAIIPRDTPFTAYVPWNTNEDWPYVAGFIYCVFGMYWMGSTLIICDTMIASIMTHISGQFKMIQKVMENIGDKALDMLSEQLDATKLKQLNAKKVMSNWNMKASANNSMAAATKEIGQKLEMDDFAARQKLLMLYYTEEDFNLAMIHCLKEAIEYHQLIIEITEDLQEAYSTAFLCQTLSSFYVIGLILVQTAQNVSNLYSLRFINNLGFLMSILWQLFIQTYSANEITAEAEKVAESAYACRWYYSDKRLARLLVVLQHRAQRPLVLTAGKFAVMSNELFLAIIKNAYQIFALITTVMTVEEH